MVGKIGILAPSILTNRRIHIIRKVLILAEISLILVLFFYLLGAFRSLGFGDWQEALFGKEILSTILLLFFLPLSTLILTRRNPGAYGLTKDNLRQHARLAWQAISVVMPAATLFLVIGLLGTDFKHWLGSFMLSLGFAAAGVVMLRYTRRTENITETKISVNGFFRLHRAVGCRRRSSLFIPTDFGVDCANHHRLDICRISRRVSLSRVRAITAQ